MLKRISDIHGIGLLYEVNGKKHSFYKATLIYSDNGRGKSTLASILRSVSLGDASLINDRKTVDGYHDPKVNLQFENGHPVTFVDGVWSETRSEILVFDADFVDRNVCSGNTIHTKHRKNLLDFALGELAVSARVELEKKNNEFEKIQQDKTNLVEKISVCHQGMAIAEFIKLKKVENVDTKICDLQKKISATENIQKIINKALPQLLIEPVFDINNVFDKLSSSLENIHKDAERMVKNHVAKLGGKDAEDWLSQGQKFKDNESCPYCGQNFSESKLIYAYQSHFNGLYNNLKENVALLSKAVANFTDLNAINNFCQSIELVSVQVNSWSEYVSLNSLNPDIESVRTSLLELHKLMDELFQKKLASPVESVGTQEEKNTASKLWEKISAFVRNTNSLITIAIQSINNWKKTLETADLLLLQQELGNLQIAKIRHEEHVSSMLDQLNSLEDAAKKANVAKKVAREEFDSLMQKTLEKYENSINELLNKFGASFSITSMGGNHRGSGPRGEYKLLLRGKQVALEHGAPSFSTALSEGDKRTLAFAFFVASVLEDEGLKNKIIVIDDPMCSLDLNRKNHTKAVLVEICLKAKQIIVLAHDFYFMRDLRDAIHHKDSVMQIATLQIARHNSDYSSFESIDLDKECRSTYSKNYHLLHEFVTNNYGDVMSVSKAIRPLLEGYLHRRFLGLISKKLLFGSIIEKIQKAEPTDPLYHAQNLVDELHEINGYAGQFHHDTNPDADQVQIKNSELNVYAKRALNVLYGGSGRG